MGHKFKVGDRVTMVNDYGLVFPDKTILTAEATTYGLAYKIEPTDSPWFAVPERNLHAQGMETREGGDAKQAPGDSLTARSRSDAPTL